MSYQEKNITVSMISTLLIFAYYLARMFQLLQQDSIDPAEVYSLWGIIVVLGIVVNIASTIITYIVLEIFHIVIKGDPPDSQVTDERDELIDLKGTRNTAYVMGAGMLISMASQIVDMPPLTMFNLLFFFAILSAIVGDFSQLYFYRRGF
ncbi:MAG: hypothetical protein RLP44_12680 [Aggregatilineales bacterium]